ncbi:MAG: hypothetical protein IH608_03200, partial [Proteobacteria bacterium]|nr:hypothetical protein [Pseudomonadota bacterium]
MTDPTALPAQPDDTLAGRGVPPALFSAWATAVADCGARLGQFVRSSESEFVTFSGVLQGCLDRARGLSGRAGEAAALVSGGEVREDFERFRDYAAKLEQHAAAGRELVTRMAGMLEATAAALHEVRAFAGEFQRSVRCLRALGISTHIEGARLSANRDQFTQLAADVQRLAEQITGKFTEVMERTGALEAEMIGTLSAVRQGSARQQVELGEVLGELEQGIAQVGTLNATAEEVSAELVSRSGELSARIFEILGSLQFQDITRQRVEHVCESLDLLQEGLQDPDATG